MVSFLSTLYMYVYGFGHNFLRLDLEGKQLDRSRRNLVNTVFLSLVSNSLTCTISVRITRSHHQDFAVSLVTKVKVREAWTFQGERVSEIGQDMTKLLSTVRWDVFRDTMQCYLEDFVHFRVYVLCSYVRVCRGVIPEKNVHLLRQFGVLCVTSYS